MSWSDDAAECSSVASGLRLEILTAAVGSVRSPQMKISFARSRVVTSTWRHYSPNRPDTLQTFPITMEVSSRTCI